MITWSRKKEEPPDYIIAIMERAKKNKALKASKLTKEERELMYTPASHEEIYNKLLEFCNKYHIKPDNILSATKAGILTR